MERIKNFFKDESGASAVEYGLLVALIAVVIIAAVSTLGTKLNATFQSAAASLPELTVIWLAGARWICIGPLMPTGRL